MSDIVNEGAPAPAESAPADNTPATETDAALTAGAEDGATPPSPDLNKEAKKEIQRQLKKYKLKVDGEEFEEELDLSNDQEIVKRLQLAKVSQKRMAEAADVRKSAEEFIALLKKDPRRILSDPMIGLDIKQFAADIINEELEEQAKSPEQREKEAMMKKIEELEGKAKKEEEGRKAAEFQKLQEKAFVQIDTEITAALKEFNLPKKGYVLNKFADLMTIAINQGLDVSPKDIAPLVKQQIVEDLQEMTGAAPDEVMEEILGKDLMTRMRKRNIAKAKAGPSVNNIKNVGDAYKPAKSEDKKPKIGLKDFLKSLK